MKINEMDVVGKEFVYDGWHKIYIIENEQDKKDAFENGYVESDFMDIEELESAYRNSCGLRFIRNWSLDKSYVEQFKKAFFS